MENEPTEGVKADIWMPLYIGDYLKDTMHLSAEEHGVYLLLIMAAWTQGGVLRDDPIILSKIGRVGPQRWIKVGPEIALFFTVENGFWIHKRIQSEWNKANKTKEKRKKAGKYAAEKRWQSHTESHTGRIPSVCPSPSPSPSLKSLKSIYSPIDFDKFWQSYPKKEGKGAAKKAYERAVKAGATPDTILAAVATAKEKSDKWREGYVPMPTTWLNQERWLDEFTVSGNASSNGHDPRPSAAAASLNLPTANDQSTLAMIGIRHGRWGDMHPLGMKAVEAVGGRMAAQELQSRDTGNWLARFRKAYEAECEAAIKAEAGRLAGAK